MNNMNLNSATSANPEPILELKDVQKWYSVNQSLINQLFGRNISHVKAVDGVSLTVNKGEILGLVGQSGSGKSTLGELIVRLQEPTRGTILLRGIDIATLKGSALKDFRRRVQIIFQDPYSTLNPRFSIYQTVAEPLIVNGIRDRTDLRRRVRTALTRAGLEANDQFLEAFPHHLSGGQRQRVSIARAIVLEPELIIADEAVSMLDVSVRSGILNLLNSLRNELDLSVIFISHDLSTIQHLCDRVAVMYLGKIMEIGPVKQVTNRAYHPYSRTLLKAVPVVDPNVKRKRTGVGKEPPSSIDLPSGCRFAAGCEFATSDCVESEPSLIELETNRWARCIHPRYEPVWE